MFGRDNHQNRKVLDHDRLAINEHVYQKTKKKRKNRIQSSKKCDCPAKVTVKEMGLYVAFSTHAEKYCIKIMRNIGAPQPE